MTREFSRIATREEKLALLDCLFAVAAAEDGISTTEDNEIRQIVNELGLSHPDFIAVRSRWKDQLYGFQAGLIARKGEKGDTSWCSLRYWLCGS